MLSQTKTGFIVESLTDGRRFPVFAHERVSALEEISIFSTEEEDIPLKDIFKKIFLKTEGKEAPDPKSDPAEIQAFFAETVPEHDPERVHASDIRKVLGWYNLLLGKGMLTFEEDDSKPVEETAPEDEKKE